MSDVKLQNALEQLYARRRLGIRPGLDVEREMLGRMGNPEHEYKVIHVTGTNGKGSVCAVVESILRTAGYRVGLYTSPHLVRFNERIQVDGRCIADGELSGLITEVERVCEDVRRGSGLEPTFFESATAIGFEYFRRRKIDVAVVEVGMGGRLDATNVVSPIVSVITRVSLEHTAYLGSDIASIAGEKCGIIKAGRPVVAGRMEEEALEVVRRTAGEKGSPLVLADDEVRVTVRDQDWISQKVDVETSGATYGAVKFPLVGLHQLENLATAIAAIEVVNGSREVSVQESDISQGVSAVQWPGRFQVLKSSPPVVLDGAHNPGAAEALARTMRRLLKAKPVGLVMGICRDKDLRNFLRPFSGLVRKLWAVPLTTESGRSTPTAEICAVGRAMGWDVRESGLAEAMAEAEMWGSQNGGAVLVTGSLFLVGEVLSNVRTT